MVTVRMSAAQLAKLEALKRATRRDASQVLRLLIETAPVPKETDIRASVKVWDPDDAD